MPETAKPTKESNMKKLIGKLDMKNTKGGALAIYGVRRYLASFKPIRKQRNRGVQAVFAKYDGIK
jgi:hypothetical protein